MTTRYTNSAIEIHLTDQTVGMSDDFMGINEEESNQKFARLLRERIERAYPQYDVAVFMESRTAGPDTYLIALPVDTSEEIDPSNPYAADADAYEVEQQMREDITFMQEKLWDEIDAWLVEAPRTTDDLKWMVDHHRGVVADTGSYRVGITPDVTGETNGYEVWVAAGGMPPHNRVDCPTWADVEAEFQDGKTLGMTLLDFTWLPAEE